MNFPNAYGFIGVGLLMEALHFLFALTPRRETWLAFMGGVLVATGGSFLIRAAWAWTLPRLISPLWALLVHPVEDGGVRLPDGSRATV